MSTEDPKDDIEEHVEDDKKDVPIGKTARERILKQMKPSNNGMDNLPSKKLICCKEINNIAGMKEVVH